MNLELYQDLIWCWQWSQLQVAFHSECLIQARNAATSASDAKGVKVPGFMCQRSFAGMPQDLSIV